MVKHRWIRHKKKVQRLERKARRLQEESKRMASLQDDDIVCPSRELEES